MNLTPEQAERILKIYNNLAHLYLRAAVQDSRYDSEQQEEDEEMVNNFRRELEILLTGTHRQAGEDI